MDADNSSFSTPLVLKFSRSVTGLRLEDGDAFELTGDDRSATVKIQKPELLKPHKSEFFVVTDQGRCRVEVLVEGVPSSAGAPKFDHDSFLFYILENSNPALLGTVNARGKAIRYSLLGLGAEQFSISEEGELRSLNPVDREKFERFDLTVRATDDKGKWTDCPGKIVVKDVNDNSPRFEKDVYEVTVDEERNLKQRITAVDPDLGENGSITYSLEDVPEGIPIDFSQGILFIGKLDRYEREEKERHALFQRHHGQRQSDGDCPSDGQGAASQEQYGYGCRHCQVGISQGKKKKV